MSEKKVGKRLLTWVLVLVMTLSLLPLNVLADGDIAIYRIVRPDEGNYITYNFYLNEGDKEPYDSQIIKKGDTLLEPKTPTAEKGTYFSGWYTDENELFESFGKYTDEIAESKTVTLYAHFDPVCYVYFMDGTGSDARIIATETLKPEGSLNSEAFDRAKLLVPVGAEQAVIGWAKEKDGEQVEEVFYVEGGSIYLYPIVANGHWITFDSKGGSYVAPLFVANGTTPTPPANPSKPGYTFDGWYDAQGKYDFNKSLSDNVELTAQWTAAGNTKYTVIHWLENADNNEYSYKELETKTGTAGEKTIAVAKRSNGDYKGFAAQTITQETIKGDGSTIVNVYYKRNVYTVKFYSYSSRFSSSEEYTNLRITAKYGANISDKWPTYDGSSTWGTADNGDKGAYQANIDTMPLGGANFYGPKTGRGSETAHYYVEVLPGETGTENKGGITYKLHHSDTSPGTGYYVTKEDKYSITGFTYKEGTPNGGDYDDAKFYYTRNSYHINFFDNSTKVNVVDKKYQQDISNVSYTLDDKEYYKFTGWFDNESGVGEPYVFTGKTMPAQDITLYAKWEPFTYTVTVYDTNKEVLKTLPNIPLRGKISEADMPEVTLADGDTFLGWTYKDGTPFNFNTEITKDIDLYARVGNKTGYTVTYDYKDDSAPVTDPSKYAKDAFATVFDGPDTAPANQVFLYWEDNASGKTYYPNSSIKITGDMTLCAVYGDKAETVTVIYHSSFGTPEKSFETKAMPNNGQTNVLDYTATNLPAREGYTFVGWKNDEGVEFKAGDSIRVDKVGQNNLYAQWKENKTETPITVTITGKTITTTYNGENQEVKVDYTVSIEGQGGYSEKDFSFTGNSTVTGKDANSYDMGLSENDFKNTNAKFTNVKFEVTDGWLKIEPRSVTLTSKDGKKVYDGTPLTKNEVKVSGDGFVKGEGATYNVTGSQKDVGKSDNTFTYTLNKGTNAKNYTITPKYGTLEVTPVTDKVTVSITGHTGGEKYSGKVQTVTGYDVTSINNKLYTENDFTFTGNAEAMGTDADTYSMGLKASDFKNTSKNFTKVEFVIKKDGSLTITKRDITLTSADDSKPYDGKPLTNDTVTVSGDGFVKGEGATYNVTGSQTEVGKSDNEFTYTLNANTKAGNYNITVQKGKLEVTAAGSVAYKVEHYKQNLDGSYNNTPNDIDAPLYGTAGTLTAAAAKDYPGFTAPQNIQQEEINADGSTTIKLKYTRNSYTLTINYVYRDGSKAAGSHIENIPYDKDYSVTSPKISGYTADKLVVSGTMPAENITVKVTYTKNGGHHPSTPTKPTVEIEDDDALGLNTTDHFAYIVGYGNGEVRPQNNITRAEVATIFFRLLTDDVRDENLTKTNRYSDVAATSWYNTAVSTLSSMGIITGYPDGTFRPNAAITRAEFAAIAARFDANGDKTTAKFSDIASHWAKDEISIAYNNGWITGYPDGTFGPQRDITRAETMTLVNRVLNRLPETEEDLLSNMTVWTDNANPNAWYYLAVQEATNSHYYEFKTNSQYEKWTELRETRDWTLLEK